ncbi:MFS transporter [Sutterella sp.]|uniref:MFS transporter n=1 Tax=Sutterella sp. TaxID=1981025 RepID=UPI0026E0CC88|nr:MFS transporter [Sutterella sp.]MDO5532205.1 MFS transporter [Sutterella sp.]
MTAEKKGKGSVIALTAALLTACTAYQLNASMVAPALVTIGAELGVGEADVGLVQTMFFTPAALFALFVPRLSDMKGRRLLLTAMLAVLALGSFLAAVAPNLATLLAARTVQGVAGPVLSVSMLMLRTEIEDEKLYATLLGLIAAVSGGLCGLDSIAGGWLASNLGFRAVFWTIGGIAAVAALMAWKFTRESKPSAGRAMDWTGVGFLVASLACLLLALNRAGANDPAIVILGFALAGFVAFRLFVAAEKRVKEPLVAIEHLRRRGTWALLLTTVLTMTGGFAVVNGTALSLAQNTAAGFGLAPHVAALYLLTPFAVAGWIASPLAGRLAPVIGYANMLRTGLAGAAASLALVLFLGISNLQWLVAGLVLMGVTFTGCAILMLNALAISLSPAENPGFLPGINSGAFCLGAGLSFAVIPPVMAAFTSSDPASTAGWSAGVTAGLVIIAAALAVSFLIPGEKKREKI